jgi:hypothetical protein
MGMQHISPKSWYYTMSRTKDCDLDNKNSHHYKKNDSPSFSAEIKYVCRYITTPFPQMCFNGVERKKKKLPLPQHNDV